MNRSEKDYRDARAAYRQLPLRQKLGHIWLYHKWPILLSLTAVLVLGSVIYRVLTRKEPVLYLALVNVAVGSELEQPLTEGFLEAAGFDPARQALQLYPDLYLARETDEQTHRSAYATRIKLMASVEQQQLDLILMSGESYGILSSQGYLLPVAELLEQAPELTDALAPLITENEVTLEDNDIEYQLGEAAEHRVVTETVANGLRLDPLPFFAARFEEPLYLGIVANTPRRGVCLDFLRYLLAAG